MTNSTINVIINNDNNTRLFAPAAMQTKNANFITYLWIRQYGPFAHLDEELPAHLVHEVNIVQNEDGRQVPKRVSG